MPEQIKRILDEWDPIGLIRLNKDEYIPIAEELADTVTKEFTPRSVYIVLKRCMSVYGMEFRCSNLECMEVAKRILKVLQED